MWAVEVLGETWKEGDLTLDQQIELEDLLGATWSRINPVLSAKHARECITSLYAAKFNIPREVAASKVGEVRTDDFVKGYDPQYEDLPTAYENGFPSQADGTATPT